MNTPLPKKQEKSVNREISLVKRKDTPIQEQNSQETKTLILKEIHEVQQQKHILQAAEGRISSDSRNKITTYSWSSSDALMNKADMIQK